MKYTLVINQKRAVEIGLNLEETLLLTCIHDLIPLVTFERNEKNEVWITHSLFIEEYPILEFNEKKLYRKLNALLEKGMITKTVKNEQSKRKSFYGLTVKSQCLFNEIHNGQNVLCTTDKIDFHNGQNGTFTTDKTELSQRTKMSDNQYTNYHNTNNHNTIIKEKNIKENSNDNSQAKEVLEYLVFKTSKTYKPTKSNLQYINARLKEGFTVDDCKKVIDVKCLDWLNEKATVDGKIKDCTDWLNPITLFRPQKFENYLNQKPRELTTKDLAKTMTFDEPPPGFKF